MVAARRNHLVETIWPALAAGRIVLCDRFADSTEAYQGYGPRRAARALAALHRFIAGDFCPGLTLILDLPAAEGLARTAPTRRGDAVRAPSRSNSTSACARVSSRSPGASRSAASSSTPAGPSPTVHDAVLAAVRRASARSAGSRRCATLCWRGMTMSDDDDDDDRRGSGRAGSHSAAARESRPHRPCEAEAALLASYKSGRLPHAWLVTGPRGVGKATLAFRFARFLLAQDASQRPLRPAAIVARGGDASIRSSAASPRAGMPTCWWSSAASMPSARRLQNEIVRRGRPRDRRLPAPDPRRRRLAGRDRRRRRHDEPQRCQCLTEDS